MAKVKIPAPLLKFTGNKSPVEVDSGTIKELIDNLEKNYPGIKKRLCEDNGEIRKFINFYVNGDDMRFLKGLDTAIKDGDDITIVPAVAGG